MNQPLGIMGTPGVGFFSLLIIGALAGWIAEKITRSDHGFLTNIIVGIAGSFVGSTLATTFNIAVHGSVGRLLAAVVGAVILVYGWRMLKGRGNQQQQQGYGNQPAPYDTNQPMPPQGQGQYGDPQGEWINEPPPGYQGDGQRYGNQPPPNNNNPLDRR